MKHYGDITKISGYDVEPVQIVVGGSPCQDLSVAGKRAGLGGARSGLFMEQIRIIKELRENDRERAIRDKRYIYPRYFVWENVVGALSSPGKDRKGEDFRAVLEETARVVDKDASIPRPSRGEWSNSGCILGDGWSIAWRVHDAQFWGVPQRRKRIALVADFGDLTAPEILFERKSVPGDTEQSRTERQSTSAEVESSIGEPNSFTLKIRGGAEYDSSGRKAGKGALIQTELSATLGLAQDQTLIQTFRKTAHPRNSEEAQGYEEAHINDTLNGCDNTEARTPTIVCQTYDARGNGDGETVCTITGDHNNRITDYTSLILKNSQEVITTSHGGFMVNADDSGIAHTLEATDHKDPQIVAYGLDRASYNQGKNAQYDFSIDEEKTSTQVAKGPGAVLSSLNSIVRRLTPKECERLQGYPDNWTNIGEWTDSKGKLHKDADSPRYKALGNSIALPFWAWMAERMVKYCGKDNLAMASLFDGIGGFPLVFSRVGVKPVWASEIEEFCVAVTKKHFPG